MELCNWTDETGLFEIPTLNYIDNYGFIYLIEYEDGTKYCGKKKIKEELTMTALKNDKKRKGHVRFKNMRRKHKLTKMEEIVKESNWRSYTGSYDKNKFDNNTIVSRKIIELYSTKKALTFSELEYQIKNNVLFDDMYRNDNIIGKFYGDVLNGENKNIRNRYENKCNYSSI